MHASFQYFLLCAVKVPADTTMSLDDLKAKVPPEKQGKFASKYMQHYCLYM